MIEEKTFHGVTWKTGLREQQNAIRQVVAKATEDLIVKGKNPTTYISKLTKDMKIKRYEAKRLLVTEGARLQTEVQKATYIENDFEEYEFIAESTACTICSVLDGKIFKVKDMQAGVNACPMHPHCHCSSGPHVDRKKALEKAKRIMNGEDEKYLEQSASIKISEKNVNNAMTVNRKLVNSKEYRDKFEELPLPKRVKQSLYENSKLILEHRDGTQGEDLYVIDSRTGKTVVNNNISKENNKVSLTKEQYDKVISNKNDVILLHNHPQGSRLSKTDIFTVFKNDNIAGSMVIGHDGEVHYIHSINRSIDVEKIYKKYYNEAKELGLPEAARNNFATDEVYKSGAFKHEKR